MDLLLATSCLQGRLLSTAVRELLEIKAKVDGIQLCPGNVPDVSTISIRTRTHHGFSWSSMRRDVWRRGELLVDADSIHPPLHDELWYVDDKTVYEVMYPGYQLGCGLEVEHAMNLGLRLAVDVSHVLIQLRTGAMSETLWRRLREYERVEEVHVSANDGTRDTHRPLVDDTFGLDWARVRGVPLILECYMHRLSAGERARQIDIVRCGA